MRRVAESGAWRQHEEAVARLLTSYADLAPDAPVRLAKRTSNLFRPRTATTSPGLDVSGLTGVIEVDPGRRTAEVQGMCTYEDLVAATLLNNLATHDKTFGVETMCVGGGQGMAMVVERLS